MSERDFETLIILQRGKASLGRDAHRCAYSLLQFSAKKDTPKRARRESAYKSVINSLP